MKSTSYVFARSTAAQLAMLFLTISFASSHAQSLTASKVQSQLAATPPDYSAKTQLQRRELTRQLLTPVLPPELRPTIAPAGVAASAVAPGASPAGLRNGQPAPSPEHPEVKLKRALFDVLQDNGTDLVTLADGKRLIFASQEHNATLRSFALLGWQGHDALYAHGFAMPACDIGRGNMQKAIDKLSRQLNMPAALAAPPELVKQRQREEQWARQQLFAAERGSSAAKSDKVARATSCDETRMRVSIFYPKGKVGSEELSTELARAMVDVIKAREARLPDRLKTSLFDIDLREFR